jgi:hypothetical protein
MTKDEARPGREPYRRWRRLLPRRARRQPDTPTAARPDQTPVDATPSSRSELGSLFEPHHSHPPPARAVPAGAGPPQPIRPAQPPPRRVSAWLLLVPALTLAVGALLGFVLGSTRASRQPTEPAPTASPSPSTRLAIPPSTRVVVRHYASPACLEAARRCDQLIDLLIRNQRRQVEDLLVAYTVAAQQCRKDATPTP